MSFTPIKILRIFLTIIVINIFKNILNHRELLRRKILEITIQPSSKEITVIKED